MEESQADDDAELFDFVDEFLDDRDRGCVRPVEHYLERYPRQTESVRREYEKLCAESERSTSDGREESDGEQMLGPYRLLRELGRGGQGSVWAAEDSRLSRTVALKLLPPSFAILSGERRARLQREAEIVARLDHPGICTVYEAQMDGEVPYIAMRLVEGAPLSDLIEAQVKRRESGAEDEQRDASASIPVGPRDGLELRELLAFFERTARALHAAHEAGIVHRDIKPANVMVTPAGEPVILDFGLAKNDDSAAGITASGDVFGTPAYMAPEQIVAASDQLDRRVDIWALGASLQEALTLSRPFIAPNTPALLAQISNGRPADPRDGCPVVDEDLRVVIATAMERGLDRRYPTALALADDLRRIRLFEPIHARPAGPFLRMRRWVRRHPAVAASTFGTIVSLALGLVVSLVLLNQVRAALGIALARQLASRAMDLVHEDPSAALALATEAVQRAPAAQTRNALYHALDAYTLRALFNGDPARMFFDIAVSPDGEHVGATLSDGSLRIYSLAGGDEVRRLGDESQQARVFQFLAGGDELFSAGADLKLRHYEVQTGQLLGEWDLGEAPQAICVEANRVWVLEKKYVTVLFRDTDHLLRWPHSLPDPRDMQLIPGRDQIVLSSADLPPPADPDVGRWIASYTPQGTMVSQTGLSGSVRALTVDEPGHFIYAAAGTKLHRVRCGDFGEATPAREFSRPLGAVACGPDGALAVAEFEREGSTAWLLTGFEGELLELAGHGGKEIVDVRFSPTGDRVATASFDLSVRSFDARNGRALRVHRLLVRPLRVAWTPDGTGLLTLTFGPTSYLWEARENRWLYRVGDGDVPLTHAAFAHDGTRMLLGDERGRVRLWDTTPAGTDLPGSPGALLREFKGHAGAVAVTRSSPEAGNWLTAGADASLLVWNDRQELPVHRFAADDPDLGAPFVDAGWSADGQVCFGLDSAGRCVIADLPNRTEEWIEGVTCAGFGPHGAVLALGSEDGRLRLLDMADLDSPLLEVGFVDGRGTTAQPVAIAFRPDGAELAMIVSDGTVHLLDTRTGAVRRDVIVRSQPAEVCYSPDGRLLLQRGNDGPKSVLFQDLLRGVELRNESWHASLLTAIDVSPDGEYWLTASKDGTAFVLRVDSTQTIPRPDSQGGPVSSQDFAAGEGPVSRLALHEGPVRFACFAPGPGPARVLTVGEDGWARIWPVDPLPAALELRPRRLRSWEIAREKRLAAPLEYEPREF